MADSGAAGVILSARTVYLYQLRGLAAPRYPALIWNDYYLPRQASEKVTYQIVGYHPTYAKFEDDGDYHVVIADRYNRTVIVEFIDPGCGGSFAPRTQISSARSAVRSFISTCGLLRSDGTYAFRYSATATVTGVAFFDYIHNPPQVGVAPNGVELHPVTALRWSC